MEIPCESLSVPSPGNSRYYDSQRYICLSSSLTRSRQCTCGWHHPKEQNRMQLCRNHDISYRKQRQCDVLSVRYYVPHIWKSRVATVDSATVAMNADRTTRQGQIQMKIAGCCKGLKDKWDTTSYATAIKIASVMMILIIPTRRYTLHINARPPTSFRNTTEIDPGEIAAPAD